VFLHFLLVADQQKTVLGFVGQATKKGEVGAQLYLTVKTGCFNLVPNV
jgi:hypothetical protein